jgi:hypothetical protein
MNDRDTKTGIHKRTNTRRDELICDILWSLATLLYGEIWNWLLPGPELYNQQSGAHILVGD